MHCSIRLATCTSVILCTVVLMLKEKLEDVWHQSSTSLYIHEAVYNAWHTADVNESSQWDEPLGDKIVVMAKLENEDTDWVSENLPE